MQHGIPQFKIANLYEDTAILQEALAAAEQMLQSHNPQIISYCEATTRQALNHLNL